MLHGRASSTAWRAAKDVRVRAVVVTGAGNAFSGGSDIREFNTSKTGHGPSLHAVIRLIESSDKPVVAAIHSLAMGGRLELAMACHYRVAAPGARIALPEVKLGLLPGAGGTQRLPRAIGLELALDMILTGDAVRSEQLVESGFFDKIIEGDLLAGAVEFAQTAASAGARPLLRDRRVQHTNPQGVLQVAGNRIASISSNFPAPAKCVDAVQAAVQKPFDEGLCAESELFAQLVNTPQSRALRHAFLAERAASRISDVPADTPVRKMQKVAVIGAGTMGAGISMNFLNAGIAVTILETKREALERGVATIRKNYEASARKGKLTQEELGQRLARLVPTLSYSDIDVVYLAGYGFPIFRGGPMFYADTVGLHNVLQATRRYAKGYRGEAWQPARLLEQLAAQGKGFND